MMQLLPIPKIKATLGIAVIAIATASNVEAQPIYDVCMHKDGGNFNSDGEAEMQFEFANSKASVAKPTSASSTDRNNFGVQDHFGWKFGLRHGYKKATTV